jgi:hypothetical protein
MYCNFPKGVIWTGCDTISTYVRIIRGVWYDQYLRTYHEGLYIGRLLFVWISFYVIYNCVIMWLWYNMLNGWKNNKKVENMILSSQDGIERT